MSAEAISMIIIIPLGVIGSIAFLTYLLVVTNISNGSYIHKKGTSLLKVDIRKRRFLQYGFKSQHSLFFKMGIRSNRNTWMPFEKITKNFEPKIQTIFSNVFHKLEKGQKNLEVDFKAPLYHNRRTMAVFKFRFDYIEEDSDFICRISWNVIPKAVKQKYSPSLLLKSEIVESSSKYKSFVAFNINKENKVARKTIVKLSSLINKEQLAYFYASNFIIFVFFANKQKKVIKKTDKFINKFKVKGYLKGANHLFTGSAYAMSSNVSEMRAINKVIQTLDFLINISIEQKTNFISAKEHLNKKDFLKYVEAFQSFRDSIKNENIGFEKIPVKSWKSKRKRIDFAMPSIEGINKKLFKNILRNENNNKYLEDAFASFVAEKKGIDIPVLVNINEEWLIENEKKFNYKKAIYVINFKRSRHKEKLIDSIERLSAKGFVFALRVTKYNEDISTFIQKINTKFVVIDSSFWAKDNLTASDGIMHLMTIKKIVDQSKLQLIYEDPSPLINDENAERIGLKFFYNL